MTILCYVMYIYLVNNFIAAQEKAQSVFTDKFKSYLNFFKNLLDNMTSTKSCIIITKMSVKQLCYLLHRVAQTLLDTHFFDVMLTVHLNIFISVINQLDTQNFCFTISLFHASTCFEHSLWYSPSSGVFFGSTSNTLSLTHFYQKDERPFLGPFRTTYSSASFPVIKAISCIAPSTLLLPTPQPTPPSF